MTDVSERLVGTYRLVSMEHYTDDGEVGRPFGEEPQGFAFYSAEGYMSAILMATGRPRFDEADILGGSSDAKQPRSQVPARTPAGGRSSAIGLSITSRRRPSPIGPAPTNRATSS